MDSFFTQHLPVILFYAAVALLIYFNRERFEFQGIVAMYKTKWGIRLMDRLAEKYPRTLRGLGYIGIFVCYIFMALMLVIIAVSTRNLFNPDAPPALTPILPGVPIPGSPVYLPLIQGIIAIFVVVVIHEFAHGVISRANDIRVKSSGLVMLGPIPGAFVEPDEEELELAEPHVSQSIFAAGPWSNLLLAIPIFLVVVAGISFVGHANEDIGVSVEAFTLNNTTHLNGLEEGDIINGINNEAIQTRYDLVNVLLETEPGETLNVSTTTGPTTVTLQESPSNASYGYLGVFASTATRKADTWQGDVYYTVKGPYDWFFGDFYGYAATPWLWIFINPFSDAFGGQLGLLGWIFLVTTGIAGANLLPIGPLDGGRMLHSTLRKWLPENIADNIWSTTTKLLLGLVLILVFIPIIRAII